MTTITIPNATTSPDFSIKELTTGELDGNGAFDIIMATLQKHLWREYENNRIRGTDYANAYVGMLNNALGQITGYALNKAKLPLELQLLEAQIQKVATDTIVATKQGGLIDAQIKKETAETERIHLEMTHKLPKELALIDAQIANMKAEVALKAYELQFIKPIQLQIMREELALKKEQVKIAIKELELKEYELLNKLPAEVRSLDAQGKLYAQKVITEKAQTDSSVIGSGSVIYHNNKVLAEQARSYDNDGKIKVLSILTDTWKVRRTDDPDTAPVDNINKLHDPVIGKSVEKVIEGVGIVL